MGNRRSKVSSDHSLLGSYLANHCPSVPPSEPRGSAQGPVGMGRDGSGPPPKHRQARALRRLLLVFRRSVLEHLSTRNALSTQLVDDTSLAFSGPERHSHHPRAGHRFPSRGTSTQAHWSGILCRHIGVYRYMERRGAGRRERERKRENRTRKYFERQVPPRQIPH